MPYAVTRVAASTSTGTQDITISGFGTPTGALFFATHATVNATANNIGAFSMGAADGTSQFVMGIVSAHNVDTMDTYRRGMTDECVMLMTATGTVNGEANFDSWITDGVRINWADNAADTAWFIIVVLFKGVTCKAGSFNLNVAQNADQDVDLGMTPDVWWACATGGALNDTASANAPWTIGAAANTVTIQQRSVGFNDRDGIVTSQVEAYLANNRTAVNMFAGISRTAEVTKFLSTGGGDAVNGVRVTKRDGASNLDIAYFGVNLAGDNKFIGSHTTPTATGNNAQTGVGFQPNFLMFVQSLLTAENTISSTDTAGGFGVGIAIGSSSYSSSFNSADNVDFSDTQSLSNTIVIHQPIHDGTDEIKATLVSFDSDGFTLNYSDVLASGRKIAVIALGAAAGGTTVPVFQSYRRMMGVA